MSQPANNPSDGIDDDRRKIRKAKRVSLFQFRKKRRKGVAANNPPPPPPFRAGCFGNIGGAGAGAGTGTGGGCLHCCLKPNPRVDSSPVEPKPSSDPNSPNFTFELLRALVEKNDFYSKECNPHFDRPEAHDN